MFRETGRDKAAPRPEGFQVTPNAAISQADVGNGTDSLLCLRVEPWAPDHRMRPGEVFTVATRADPERRAAWESDLSGRCARYPAASGTGE